MGPQFFYLCWWKIGYDIITPVGGVRKIEVPQLFPIKAPTDLLRHVLVAPK